MTYLTLVAMILSIGASACVIWDFVQRHWLKR
jgi:hypothetical protein